MDVDSLLAESIPPRYAIESDEEDEFNPLRSESQKKWTDDRNVDYNVRVVLGDALSQKRLIIASGNAGKVWASGADLGEEKGAVYVNEIKVAFVLDPSWTQAVVILSESYTRLPLPAMYPYAEAILKALKPSSVALLDTYPLPTYATDRPNNLHEAPLRYLTTNNKPHFFETSGVHLFAPPNLIQSTSASFLTILSLASIVGTLILLPSPNIPTTRPTRLTLNDSSAFGPDKDECTSESLRKVHRLLFQVIGEDSVVEEKAWPLGKRGEIKERVLRKNTEIAEGGMYI